MKKQKRLGVLLMIVFGVALGKVSAFSEFDSAKWAHENELFSFDQKFTSEQKLKREEAASIMYNFFSNIIKQEKDSSDCKATDLNSAEKKYRGNLSFLCEQEILLGEKNKLLPKQGLTRAQAVVMVIRAIDKPQKESTLNGQHRSENYFKRASELGIDTQNIKKIKNQTITFQELINLLYASQHPDENLKKSTNSVRKNTTSSNDFDYSDDLLEELLNILNS